MKIVVTGTRGFPDVQGGVENHCEHLYPHVAELGAEVTVFTRRPYISHQLSEYKGIRLVPLACPRNKFLEAIIHTLRSIVRARTLQPDILHIHAIGPSVFAPLAKAFGMNVVVTHHGPDYKREKWTLPAKVFLKFCEWAGMVFADEIIAISRNISDDVLRKFGRESAVIPNGIEIPELTDSDETLRKFGLGRKRYILAVGRFVPEKGFHDLIEAFMAGDHREFRLVIAGDADHQSNYSRKLKEMAALSDSIILTGFIAGEPLRELFSNAALFALPSYYEGLPIALLEAMSYGLPCIASDIPANRNLPLAEINFFKKGDINALSQKIDEFIYSDWDEQKGLSQRNLIYELYNWRKIAEKTMEVYKNLIT